MSRGIGFVAVLGALGILGLAGTPARAQVEPGTHELHAFAGYLFGDDLTDTPISGVTPELDDDWAVGARYVYNFTEALGIDAAFSYSPDKVTNLATGDIDLDIMMFDVDAIWSFTPGARLAPYVLGGIGYALTDLDSPITGTVDGLPVVIEDDDGFTANVGAGVRYFINDLVQLRFEARYRYIHRLVDNFDDSLNSFDATIGVGMRF